VVVGAFVFVWLSFGVAWSLFLVYFRLKIAPHWCGALAFDKLQGVAQFCPVLGLFCGSFGLGVLLGWCGEKLAIKKRALIVARSFTCYFLLFLL
jgi:hypothetical protein